MSSTNGFRGWPAFGRGCITWEVVRTLADALNDVAARRCVPCRCRIALSTAGSPSSFPRTIRSDPTRPFGISRDTLSIAAHGASAFQAGVRQRGLLLDDWTEEIPTAEREHRHLVPLQSAQRRAAADVVVGGHAGRDRGLELGRSGRHAERHAARARSGAPSSRRSSRRKGFVVERAGAGAGVRIQHARRRPTCRST